MQFTSFFNTTSRMATALNDVTPTSGWGGLTPPVHHIHPAPTNTSDTLSGILLEDALLHNAESKLANSIDKTFFLGLLGGFWMAMGGIAASSAAGGIPADIRQRWPVLPKLGVAMFFPFSLVHILRHSRLSRDSFLLAVASDYSVWRRGADDTSLNHQITHQTP